MLPGLYKVKLYNGCQEMLVFPEPEVIFIVSALGQLIAFPSYNKFP